QGLFARATAHIAPRHDLEVSVLQRLARGESVQAAGLQHAPRIAATLSAVLVVALLAGVIFWLGPAGARSGTSGSANSPTTPTQTPVPAPFTVTSVALSVNPTSIAGTTCGSQATFTYTTVFHIPAHTAGGAIQFSYTLNNGRSQTSGTVTAGAGETSKTFQFVSSASLSSDHTYPGVALVMVTSPNTVGSPSVQPSGSCVQPGPFQVSAVSMTVSPTSIAGTRCGTFLTVTYTALFHLAPNGAGGTIHFDYTISAGRGDHMAT